MADDTTAVLARPPQVPADVARFTSGVLFGEPGIYPDGPPMQPASGHEHSDTAIEEVTRLEEVGLTTEPIGYVPLVDWLDGESVR